MRPISVDGLSACRGSMSCIREGLIRQFIFKVRLSGPFKRAFGLNFRLIISAVFLNDVIVCKSLICFCSGTPGGRVDVVERMIGYIFVDMWAFLAGN